MTYDEFVALVDAHGTAAAHFDAGADPEPMHAARAALLAAFDDLEAERDRLAERFITRDFFEKEWMPVLRAAESRATRLAAALRGLIALVRYIAKEMRGQGYRLDSEAWLKDSRFTAARAALREEPPAPCGKCAPCERGRPDACLFVRWGGALKAMADGAAPVREEPAPEAPRCEKHGIALRPVGHFACDRCIDESVAQTHAMIREAHEMLHGAAPEEPAPATPGRTDDKPTS